MREKLCAIGVRGTMWRMMKNTTECARTAVMLDEEISNYYVDISKVAAQGCTLSHSLFKVHLNDIAVEAAEQGVSVGEDMVSGLTFADDFGGIGNARRIAET